MAYRVGVDIGGTFADFCAFNESTGQLHTLKVLSRPDAPGTEVIEGIRQLKTRFGIDPRSITYFTHGTTVGVNTVIQRKGAPLALLTTERFTDVLEVARLKMPDPYDLLSTRPVPLIPKDMVRGVAERILADGTVLRPLDQASLLAAVDAVKKRGAEGIVIAFINAYRNPAHEHTARDIIRAAHPGLHVFYEETVLRIPDGKPKQKDVPAELGGSGTLLAD